MILGEAFIGDVYGLSTTATSHSVFFVVNEHSTLSVIIDFHHGALTSFESIELHKLEGLPVNRKDSTLSQPSTATTSKRIHRVTKDLNSVVTVGPAGDSTRAFLTALLIFDKGKDADKEKATPTHYELNFEFESMQVSPSILNSIFRF